MQNVILNLFADLLRAAAIWIVLVVFAVLALVGVLGRPRRHNTITPELRARGVLLKQARLRMRAETLERFAREAELTAQAAAQTASRRRDEWHEAQGQAESAWVAFDRADGEALRIILASKLPMPQCSLTPSEFAFRERYLHRSAMVACSHRGLSALDLSDALANRNGWDPRLHPLEQDVVMVRMVRQTMLENYRAAVQREEHAWVAADVAAADAVRLRLEAAAAAEQAVAARRLVRPARSATQQVRERLDLGVRASASGV